MWAVTCHCPQCSPQGSESPGPGAGWRKGCRSSLSPGEAGCPEWGSAGTVFGLLSVWVDLTVSDHRIPLPTNDNRLPEARLGS